MLTPQAQEDLKVIVSFIARVDSRRARTFGNTLIDKALSLSKHPEKGRVVPEQNDPAVREIIYKAYRIVYEVVAEPNAVFILRFWHAARGTPDV